MVEVKNPASVDYIPTLARPRASDCGEFSHLVSLLSPAPDEWMRVADDSSR